MTVVETDKSSECSLYYFWSIVQLYGFPSGSTERCASTEEETSKVNKINSKLSERSEISVLDLEEHSDMV